jgi:putative endonuclease
MACSFYILYSQQGDSYYIGHTCDELEERLRKHNSNHSGYTGALSDWSVVHFEEFPDKSAAYKREREVKAWKSRKRIEALISRHSSAGSEHPGP